MILLLSILHVSELEHLEIEEILVSILESSDFKRVFNFPQLKYLHISAFDYRRAVSHIFIIFKIVKWANTRWAYWEKC